MITAKDDAMKSETKDAIDRTAAIERLYLLYKKSRRYLLKRLKDVSDESLKEETVDILMMQMLVLWYLQEKGFFNNDTSYFVTKFKELNQKIPHRFTCYHEFLTYFLEKIGGRTHDRTYEDSLVETCVAVRPAVFLTEEDSLTVSLPDACFYVDGVTDYLINTPPTKVKGPVPLLNLLESRTWTEGLIDEFVLGALFEKLIATKERKNLGAYYTPETVTHYICKNTIVPYLIDAVNEESGKAFESIDQIVETGDKKILSCLFQFLKEMKILDPAVGSAHFLESAIIVLLKIYEQIWEKAKERGLESLEILVADEKGEITPLDLLNISERRQFRLYVTLFIVLPRTIYGVDINPRAVKVARARLFLTLAKHFDVGTDSLSLSNAYVNVRTGNALVGYSNLETLEEFTWSPAEELLSTGTLSNHVTEMSTPFRSKIDETFAQEHSIDGDELKRMNPFHWVHEFPEVFLTRGGFDVVVGNPPYRDLSDVEYRSFCGESKDLYDAFMRISMRMLCENGRFGLIHANSAYCQPKFKSLREFLKQNANDITIVHFGIRPQPVFKGVMQRTAITLCKKDSSEPKRVKTSRYLRLTEDDRNQILQNPPVYDSSDFAFNFDDFIPKIGNNLDYDIFRKVFSNNRTIQNLREKKGTPIFYHDSGESYWTKALNYEPRGYRNGKEEKAAQWLKIEVNPTCADFVLCALNSSLFYWYWLTVSDCRHLTQKVIGQFPIPRKEFTLDSWEPFERAARELMECYKKNSYYVEKRKGYQSLEFKVNRCKCVIASIDELIGKMYGLTDQEIEYLMQYDSDMKPDCTQY